MTISSPVGTVGTYTFTSTDVLFEAVSLGLSWPTPGIYAWLLPPHDGDVRIFCVGGKGGQQRSASAYGKGGGQGRIRGFADLPNAAALTVVVGDRGGDVIGGSGAGGAGGGPTCGVRRRTRPGGR